MKKILLLLFFALGFLSLLTQTLVIREFIVSFGGNELGIGIFYFFWLFWVGIGAVCVTTFLGKVLHRHFLRLLMVYPLLSFIGIFLFISLRKVANVQVWEFFPLEKAILYLFLFTSLISFFTGIIFTLGVVWLKKRKETSATTLIAGSYIFESLGSFFSGCLGTFLLAQLWPPLIILTLGSLFFAIAAFVVSTYFRDRVSTYSNFFLALFFIVLMVSPQKMFDFFSGERLHNLIPHAQLISEVSTPYQHILIGNLPSQRIVLSNGEVISSLPEVVDSDRESALFVAEADMPKRVLLIGYGVENLINSLLKFHIENITYCVEDTVYYKEVYKNLPAAMQERLTDQRLRIIFQSPRLFLKEKKEQFDLIVIYFSDPTTLAVNSFFTEEFFALARGNLKERGVLATRMRSAENFLGEEIRNYGSSLYYTLRELFHRVIIVPGDTNWFFAGGASAPVADDPLVLESRFIRYTPVTFSFLPQGFRTIFLPERVKFMKEMYKDNQFFDRSKLINRDSQPVTFFLNLLVFARYSNSLLVTFLKRAFLAGPIIFFIPFIFFFLGRIYFLVRIENIISNRQLFHSKLFQFFSGFLGFSFHLTLMFLFQNRFGTLYQFIGLVNGIFMVGLCLGGMIGALLVKKFSTVHSIIGVLVVQAGVIWGGFTVLTHSDVLAQLLFALYILVFLVSGVLTGSSYPLVAELFQRHKVVLQETAAVLELLDHWGGAVGGLVTTLFFLPLIGTQCTVYILCTIAVLMIILFSVEFFPLALLKEQLRPRFMSFPFFGRTIVLILIAVTFIVCSFILRQQHAREMKERKPIQEQGGETLRWQAEPFPAYIASTVQGEEYIIETKHFARHIHGFGGPINLRLRIGGQGEIKEIEVLEHNETPEYVKAGFSRFIGQFKGKLLKEDVSLTTVDAISGATITSRAIIDIITETRRNLSERMAGRATKEKIKSEVLFDRPTIALVILAFVAFVLYVFFAKQGTLRKLYLFCVVIVLGFLYNMVFSSYHLANLSMGTVPWLSPQVLLYGIPVLLGLLFGQIWCGWICPFGALQELLGCTHLAVKITPYLDKKMRYSKYIFLTIFIVVVCLTGSAAWFKREPLAVFFLKLGEFSKDMLFSSGVIILSLFFLRFWCRYFCVCGAFLSLFNKIALLRRFFIKQYNHCPFGVSGVHDVDCIHCNICMIESVKNNKKQGDDGKHNR